MTDQTPRNSFSYPSLREEPHFESTKAGMLQIDAAVFANADNSNIQFTGGGVFSWDASANLLFWTDAVLVTGMHTAFGGEIVTGSVLIQEDEVVYFQMPRLVQTQNAQLTLLRSSRIFLEGTNLHDLRLFVVRKGTTLYFYNGLSLKDGDTGVLFGQGLLPIQTVLPHKHEIPFKFIPAGAGISSFSLPAVPLAPDLVRIDLFRNGVLQVEGAGDDYTVDLTTGVVSLTVATVLVLGSPEKFIVWRETRDFTVLVSSHQHAAKLIIKPTPGTLVLNALVTAPFLLRVDVSRNGQLLVEGAGDDYTVDLATGLITLLVASVLDDKFEIARELAIP